MRQLWQNKRKYKSYRQEELVFFLKNHNVTACEVWLTAGEGRPA